MHVQVVIHFLSLFILFYFKHTSTFTGRRAECNVAEPTFSKLGMGGIPLHSGIGGRGMGNFEREFLFCGFISFGLMATWIWGVRSLKFHDIVFQKELFLTFAHYGLL